VPLSVRYHSRRGEVWSAYGRLWRERLWKRHLAFAAMVVAGLLLFGGLPASPGRWAAIALVALALPLFQTLYPQLAFKPQERVLTLDASGIVTTIGKRAGEVPWSEVAEVHQGENVTITLTNGNAFVVPARAFASEEEQRRFADSAISSALRAAA
jgi:hypothetical protein